MALFPVLAGWSLLLLPVQIVFLELIIDPADHGRAHVGGRAEVGDRDAAAALAGEIASRLKRPERFAGKVHPDEDLDPAARHVRI